MALGEMDGDGRLELVVVTAEGSVVARELDGSPERFWPAVVWRADEAPPRELRAGPRILPPETGREGWIVVPRPRGLVAALDAEARHVAGFPQALGYELEDAVQLADLEGDGDLELVAGDGTGHVTVLDVPAPWHPAPGAWRYLGGNARRDRVLTREDLPPAAEPDAALVDGGIRIYPNPVRGFDAVLDVGLRRPATVRLEVLDTQGYRVAQWEWPAEGGPLGERFEFSTSGLAPGLYVCRITVQSEKERIRTLRKMAIVR
jgi:hypothetical protein